MTSIRLIIASPVRLVREGLAATLGGREGLVVADAVDLGPPGIARITDAEPDVVLVDVGETETDTVSAARLIKSASPGVKLVAFGLDEVDDRVFACAAAGFSGYVPRESDADDLHRALVDAMEGRMHCAPHIGCNVQSPRQPLAGGRSTLLVAVPDIARERNPRPRGTRSL